MILSPGSGLSGAAVAATVALCVIATGCGRSLPGATSGQAIADGGGYLLTADSATLETGITFKALGDSALRIARADATTSVIAAPADTIAGAFGYKSDQPMVDILFRLEQTHHTPRGGITLNPLEIYIWPLPAETTSPLLEARIANGYITPVESRRYSWPVVNDEPQWSLAALEVALAGGSQQYCRRITPVVDNLTKTAATMMQNHATGLYESLPRHFAGQNAGMPSWATPTDLFQTMTLCHNVAWYGVAQARQAVDSTLTRRHKRLTNNTATVPDSLGRIIKTRFWMPNRGQLSAMLYGSPETPLQLAATDNSAQALAIITGLAPKPMAQAIVRRTPATRTGVTETYPLLTPAPQGSATGNMLLQTLWAVACCRSDNPAAADMAIAGLLLQRLRHLASTSDLTPTISRPVTTIIARCLAGISFHPDGIAFNPYVPH
ncbi:MAG: hypothetical protein K2O10_02045, partial [Muribaculaceae bacterium]|nr:hypothetical protein [Muribaculaceae bacterium]